jgi:glycosyltransferase involved in cell wall biosynthesis
MMPTGSSVRMMEEEMHPLALGADPSCVPGGQLSVAPESLSSPGLLVVIQWLIHGGADRATLELLQGIKQLAPGVRRYLVTTIPTKMEWASEVEQAVDGVFSLPSVSGSDPADELAQLIELLEVSAVLVVNSITGYDALPLIRRSGRKVRVISQLHGFMRDPRTSELIGHSVYAASRYDGLIDGYSVISGFVAEQLIHHFRVSRAKIRVLYCGVDLERFTSARRSRFQPGFPIEVLWLGRFSWEKDPGMAVRVARAWKERHGSRNIHFSLVGNGELREEVERQIHSGELNDIITLVSAVDDPLPLYRSADCLMMTSRYEGIPLVIYQAMSAGLPIVTPIRNTAIPEVLAPNDAYFVNQQRVTTEYLSALEQMLCQPGDARAKAERAATSAAPYKREKHIKEMLELLFTTAL